MCIVMNHNEVYRNIILINFLVPLVAMVLSFMVIVSLIAELFIYFGMQNPFSAPVSYWSMFGWVCFINARHLFNHTARRLESYDVSFAITKKQELFVAIVYWIAFIVVFYSIFRLAHSPMKSCVNVMLFVGLWIGAHFLGEILQIFSKTNHNS